MTSNLAELKSIYDDTKEVYLKYAGEQTDWKNLARDMEAINSRLMNVRLRDDHNWSFHNLVRNAVADVVDSNLIYCTHMVLWGKSDSVIPHI